LTDFTKEFYHWLMVSDNEAQRQYKRSAGFRRTNFQ